MPPSSPDEHRLFPGRRNDKAEDLSTYIFLPVTLDQAHKYELLEVCRGWAPLETDLSQGLRIIKNHRGFRVMCIRSGIK